MVAGAMPLQYCENPKHKPGSSGEGPPRWFPTSDSLCPDDLSARDALMLLRASIEGNDPAHPNARARYAIDGQGRFFKAYSHDGGVSWHGYPVRRELVPRQVPTRVLRRFIEDGVLSRAEYRRLLGSAR